MHIADAQKEVRSVYLGGFAGGLVTGGIWILSAALGTWHSPRLGILSLIIVGSFIYPLLVLVLKLMGRKATLSHENPFGQLAMQVAFTIPACYPLIAAATIHRLSWFYPAFLVVVGAHYLPFIFLYGMPIFGGLALLMIAAGVWVGIQMPDSFSAGGWIGAALLIGFGLVGRTVVAREEKA